MLPILTLKMLKLSYFSEPHIGRNIERSSKSYFGTLWDSLLRGKSA